MLKNRLLCIFLPKMGAYRTNFDKAKCLSFVIKVEKLLEKYNKLRKKLLALSKKNLTVNKNHKNI